MHTEVRHHAAHRVNVTGAVEHTRSAIGGWHRRWAVEGARVSFSNTGLRHHAAHGVDGSGTVDHTLSTVGSGSRWAVEGTFVSLSHAGLRHHAAHGVDWTGTVDHAFSTVHGWHMWTEEWTLSPSAMQVSAIMQPMESIGPGQLIEPSPQSMGGIGGQGAGTARAVERRVRSRTDISRLTLPM